MGNAAAGAAAAKGNDDGQLSSEKISPSKTRAEGSNNSTKRPFPEDDALDFKKPFKIASKQISLRAVVQNGPLDESTKHPPIPVEINVHLPTIACGFSHSVALGYDGSIYSWGIGDPAGVPARDVDNNEDEVSLGGSKGESCLGDEFVRFCEQKCEKDWDHKETNLTDFDRVWNENLKEGDIHEHSKQLRHLKKCYMSSVPFPYTSLPSAVKGVFCSDFTTALLHEEGNMVTIWHKDRVDLPLSQLFNLRILSVACGANHVLFLNANYQVQSMGQGIYGCLGHGNSEDCPYAPRPIEFLQPYQVRHIAAGSKHSLCTSTSGLLFSWGNGDNGRLGLGLVRGGQWRPTHIPLEAKAALVYCGESHSAMVSETTQELFTWGSYSFGKLGLGELGGDVFVPTRVDSLNVRVTLVSLGTVHSGCLSDQGELFMWGSTSHAKLGVIDTALQHQAIVSQPVSSFPGVQFTELCCGCSHSLAKIRTGEVISFGLRAAPYLGHATKRPLLLRASKNLVNVVSQFVVPKVTPPDAPYNAHFRNDDEDDEDLEGAGNNARLSIIEHRSSVVALVLADDDEDDDLYDMTREEREASGALLRQFNDSQKLMFGTFKTNQELCLLVQKVLRSAPFHRDVVTHATSIQYGLSPKLIVNRHEELVGKREELLREWKELRNQRDELVHIQAKLGERIEIAVAKLPKQFPIKKRKLESIFVSPFAKRRGIPSSFRALVWKQSMIREEKVRTVQILKNDQHRIKQCGSVMSYLLMYPQEMNKLFVYLKSSSVNMNLFLKLCRDLYPVATSAQANEQFVEVMRLITLKEMEAIASKLEGSNSMVRANDPLVISESLVPQLFQQVLVQDNPIVSEWLVNELNVFWQELSTITAPLETDPFAVLETIRRKAQSIKSSIYLPDIKEELPFDATLALQRRKDIYSNIPHARRVIEQNVHKIEKLLEFLLTFLQRPNLLLLLPLRIGEVVNNYRQAVEWSFDLKDNPLAVNMVVSRFLLANLLQPVLTRVAPSKLMGSNLALLLSLLDQVLDCRLPAPFDATVWLGNLGSFCWKQREEVMMMMMMANRGEQDLRNDDNYEPQILLRHLIEEDLSTGATHFIYPSVRVLHFVELTVVPYLVQNRQHESLAGQNAENFSGFVEMMRKHELDQALSVISATLSISSSFSRRSSRQQRRRILLLSKKKNPPPLSLNNPLPKTVDFSDFSDHLLVTTELELRMKSTFYKGNELPNPFSNDLDLLLATTDDFKLRLVIALMRIDLEKPSPESIPQQIINTGLLSPKELGPLTVGDTKEAVNDYFIQQTLQVVLLSHLERSKFMKVIVHDLSLVNALLVRVKQCQDEFVLAKSRLEAYEKCLKQGVQNQQNYQVVQPFLASSTTAPLLVATHDSPSSSFKQKKRKKFWLF